MGSPATPTTDTQTQAAGVNNQWDKSSVCDRQQEATLRGVHVVGLLTSDAYWPDGVLVESEAFLQSVSSHVFIEDVAAGEIQNAAVVLVFGDEPRRRNKGKTPSARKTFLFILWHNGYGRK